MLEHCDSLSEHPPHDVNVVEGAVDFASSSSSNINEHGEERVSPHGESQSVPLVVDSAKAPKVKRPHSKHPRDKGIACLRYASDGHCDVRNCPYMHVTRDTRLPVPRAVCGYYLRSRCLRDQCPFYHSTRQRLDALIASGAKDYCPLEGTPMRDPLEHVPPGGLPSAAELTGARPLAVTRPKTAPQSAATAWTPSVRVGGNLISTPSHSEGHLCDRGVPPRAPPPLGDPVSSTASFASPPLLGLATPSSWAPLTPQQQFVSAIPLLRSMTPQCLPHTQVFAPQRYVSPQGHPDCPVSSPFQLATLEPIPFQNVSHPASAGARGSEQQQQQQPLFVVLMSNEDNMAPPSGGFPVAWLQQQHGK